MKRIEVVAALIVKEGRVFATQRGYGPWKDWWEFPGGKMEPGESREDALRREISEELSCSILVGDLLDTVEWDYPEFHLTMHCFLCALDGEAPHLNEHEAARWLCAGELASVHWLATREGATDVDAVMRGFNAWGKAKRRFTRRQAEIAFDRLTQKLFVRRREE